jgi:hypothetical protein
MSGKGAGAGSGTKGKGGPSAPSTATAAPPPPPLPTVVSMTDLEKIRKKSDKAIQHYNYRAAQKVLNPYAAPLFMSKIQKEGFILAKEITNKLNDSSVESKRIRCHARTLLNQHALTLPGGLNTKPINENEPYYFFVRFKVTSSNSIYFNLDFYLPTRRDPTTPTDPMIIKEIVHFSIHSNPSQPLYVMKYDKKAKQMVRTNTVNETGVWKKSGQESATDFNGMIHAYESQFIDGIPPPDPSKPDKQVRPLRRFLLLLHRRATNARTNDLLTDVDYRKELVLLNQRSKTVEKSLHPMSIAFMKICIETLQQYFDTNYDLTRFATLFDGPKIPYTTIQQNTLPAKPADMATIITKDSANGLNWAKLFANHANLASEMAARLQRTGSTIKMQALDLYVKQIYNGNYDYNIKLNPALPMTNCLKDISILYVTSSITDHGKTVNFSLIFHFRWDDEKSYDTKVISSISFKNYGTPPPKQTYKGYIYLKEYFPVINTASERFYTLDTTTKNITPLYQTGSLTSISVAFGNLATQVMSDFIRSNYTLFTPTYYDCSDVGEDGPVEPPDDQAKDLPKYGGRRTRSNRQKRKSTRKINKRG